MIPAMMPFSVAITGSLVPADANVMLMLRADALPLFDRGNVGIGVSNHGGTIDGTTKPAWAAGSFSTGASGSHAKGMRLPELGSNFTLGTAFCVEGECYYGSGSGGLRIFDTRATIADTTGWYFLVDGSQQLIFWANNTAYGASSPTPSATVTVDTFSHLRASYDGTTLRLFINGSVVWSAAASINITTNSDLAIGNANTLDQGFANQFLSELRIVKGEALNTGSFIRPSAAWQSIGADIAQQTNVTYSNVVLRSTYDANVNDVSAAARTMTAAGGAASSSGVSKFGGGSLLLDGTGDYLSTPNSADFDFGSGDYQVQMWAYRNGAKTEFVISCYTGAAAGWSMEVLSDKLLWTEAGDTTTLTSVASIAQTTWTHVAAGRKDGITYIFVDGVLEVWGRLAKTADCSGTLFVGRLNNSFAAYDWLGSIDDLQLVKGECQLTKSFLVPTAALPTS